MTFGDTYKELLSLADKSDVSSAYYAQGAVNRAIAWALNQLDFVLNEKSQTLVYDPAAATHTLPSDCLRLLSASLGDVPIDVISEAQLIERKRRYYDLRGESLTAESLTRYEDTFTYGAEHPVLCLGGTYYFLLPSASATLTLLYQKKFTPLTADADTHFLLDNFSDLIVLRCLCASSFRARLSPEMASSFPLELFQQEWDNVVKWNASIRSNQFKIG